MRWFLYNDLAALLVNNCKQTKQKSESKKRKGKGKKPTMSKKESVNDECTLHAGVHPQCVNEHSKPERMSAITLKPHCVSLTLSPITIMTSRWKPLINMFLRRQAFYQW